MKRVVLLFVAFALLTGFGIADGIRTERWRDRPDPAVAAARLGQLPLTVGEWAGVEEQLAGAERARKVARLDGCVVRKYTHAQTGKAVQVFLVSGAPAPIAGHSPELCYQGLGYRLPSVPDRKRVPGAAAEFWAGRFEQTGQAEQPPLNIWWSWTADGPWEAPDRPQARFVRVDVLYKLYLIRPTDQPTPAAADPVLAEFAEAVLPAVGATLFPAAPNR